MSKPGTRPVGGPQGGQPMGGPGGGPGKHARAMGGGKPKETRVTIGRLLSYMAPDKGYIVLALFFVLLFSGATLAGSYLLSPVIDNITKYATLVHKANAVNADTSALIQEGTAVLLKGILTMLVVYVAGIAAQYLQQRIMIGVSQRALIRIRKDLFNHLQDLPVRYFDTNSTGDVMSRFTNDVDMIGELLNNTVVQLISGIISIVGTVSIMLYMNVWLALLTIIMVPVMLKAGGGIARRSSRFYRQQQNALGALMVAKMVDF